MKTFFTTLLLLIFSCQANAIDIEDKPDSFKYQACYQAFNEIQKMLNDDQEFKASSDRIKSVFFKAAVKSYMTEKVITKVKASKIVSTPIKDISSMNFANLAAFIDSSCDSDLHKQAKAVISSKTSNSNDAKESKQSRQSLNNKASEGDTVFIHLREYRGNYYAVATVERIAGEKVKVNIDDICSDVGCGYSSLSSSEYDMNKAYWVYKSDLMNSRPF